MALGPDLRVETWNEELEAITGMPGRKLVMMSTIAGAREHVPVGLHLFRPTPDPGPELDASSELTARQQQVVELIADGAPAKVIAARLGIAEATVRNHIRAILLQLGCHSQLEAIAEARRRRLLSPSPAAGLHRRHDLGRRAAKAALDENRLRVGRLGELTR
jgi:DNA-binding CsgD family transcriptional regulator